MNCPECGSTRVYRPGLLRRVRSRIRSGGTVVLACKDCGHVEFDPPVENVSFMEVDRSLEKFRRVMGTGKTERKA